MIKALSFRKLAPEVATLEDLAILETKMGVRFPPAFVEFCSRWNGGFPTNDNKFYPVPSLFKEFYAEYKSSKGIYVDILFGATEKLLQCSLIEECVLLEELSKLFIPITVDLFGDHVVLRADSPMGFVYWWDHELWETPDIPNPMGNVAERPRLIPIAQDLESFYNSLTSDPDAPGDR